jgi:predicted TIM-barrel fold metal-dependent hydrolase
MRMAIYDKLKVGTQHQDIGADHCDRRSSGAKVRRYVTRLARLGFHVELQPVAQAA